MPQTLHDAVQKALIAEEEITRGVRVGILQDRLDR
jgi:hypothetical protein